jgi:hypothetical protein
VRCNSELSAQQRIFDDPRCPAEVLALRDMALKNTYRIWSFYALVQEETSLGQGYLREAARLVPSIVEGTPSELVDFVLICSVDDDNQDHQVILKTIFAQLPAEMAHLSMQYDWAVARGFLIKGVRAIVWDRLEDGSRHLEQAAKLGARLDDALISQFTRDLLNYEVEFGEASVRGKIKTLAACLEKIGGRSGVRRLIGCYSANRAFESYRAGKFANVPGSIVPAIVNDPKYLVNRGVWSVLFRSVFGMGAGSAPGHQKVGNG